LDVVKQTPASEEEVVIAPAVTPADSTSFNFGSLLPIIAIGGAVYYFATKKK
jgi:hypothetical protein